MLRRHIVTAAVIAAVAMPAVAFAAAATKAKTYYAEQSVKTKYCYVVTFKPDGKAATQIGTDSFDTFAKAWAAIKADTDCKSPVKATVTKASAKTTTTTTTTTKPATPPKKP